jgi:hypothetical protein
MVISGVLVFAVAMFFVTLLIGKANDFDKGRIATYVTIIAWSSMVFGLFIGRTIQ